MRKHLNKRFRACCAAVVSVLTVACGSDVAQTGATAARAGEAGALTCAPDTVSKLVFTTLTTMHRRNPVPALSAAVYVPSLMTVPATAVVGVISHPNGRAVHANDRFLAGSVGKTFFAALAMRKASRGELQLDVPLTAYLPVVNVPSFAWITPRMLLTHTSGIGEYDGDFMTALIREPLRERTPSDWLGVIRRHPPAQSDAGTFRYSDLNYVVLAMVLDGGVLDGAYRAIDATFLQPLGLARTSPSVTLRIDGLVSGYEDSTSMFGTDAMVRDGALIYNPQFEWGGGGYVSTPTDLARWMVALRTGVAFPDTLWSAVIAKPAGVADTAHSWRGMGVHVDSSAMGMMFGHSGYMPGYVSWMRWYEALGMSVAMQVSATDRTRLPDDGFDWMDSIAVAVAAKCSAPPFSDGKTVGEK